MVELTEEQQRILNFAKTGHNVCIFGKAGVGKSVLVEAIKETLTSKGLICQVVCSSGVSCDSYGGTAKTVHSQYGLQTAELPANVLIQRAFKQNNVIERVSKTDVLIWDEISMSSCRIFHIVNAIHHIIAANNFAFGGIQVIIVGDFWQLKPVPSPLDPGDSVFTSELFDKVFPHRFEMQRVLRQRDDEYRLKHALDALRNGECSDEIEEYFKSLERELEQESEPVHIYFKRLPAEVHNLNILRDLPGELLTFHSQDVGDADHLEVVAEKVLMLKPGCKVMLKYNISRHLKNGYKGHFVGVDPNDGEQLIVDVAPVGKVSLSRKTWYKRGRDSAIQASRTQFPLTLSYAVTVHKTQSLTLPCVVVHCAPEFAPFQTYVAISRVKAEKHLQVIDFRKRFLLPVPPDLLNLSLTDADNHCHDMFNCCKCMDLDGDLFSCSDSKEDDAPHFEEDDDVMCNCDSPSPHFQTTNDRPVEYFKNIIKCMSSFGEELARLPTTFIMTDFLEKIISDMTEDAYSQSIKDAAEHGTRYPEVFALLAHVFWRRISRMYKEHVSEHVMSSNDFTSATAKLHEFFQSQEYRNDMVVAFNVANWTEINDGHRGVGVMLSFNLFQMFAEEVGKKVSCQEGEPINFRVSEMGPDGLGKIRYIGGWVVKKLMDSARRYVMENKASETSHVREKINRQMEKITLLENNIIISHQEAEASDRFPGTLVQVESRQYRERGLLHITDDAFQFMLAIEQERVDKINLANFSSLQSSMIEKSITETISNATLQAKFLSLFVIHSEGTRAIILDVYKDLVRKYFKMGAGQFLRDFRREFHVQKAIALRKAVLLRKQRKEEKKMKVTLRQLEQDRSPGKVSCHHRLRDLLHSVGDAGMKRLYKKAELQRLCDAYDVRHTSRWNKGKLVTELAKSIRQQNVMPNHQLLSTYAVVSEVQRDGHEDENNIPLLRIRRL